MATALTVPRRHPVRYAGETRVLLISVACYGLVLALLVAPASGVLPRLCTALRWHVWLSPAGDTAGQPYDG
jgi:hypothetical protein